MRFFVAIEVGPEIAAAAEELIGELRRRTAARAPRARITWAAADRLHVTVRFIGQADEARAHDILGALAPEFDVRAFDLSVANIGAFPGRGAPRVLWAGLTAGRDAVLEVERAVSARLETARPS